MKRREKKTWQEKGRRIDLEKAPVKRKKMLFFSPQGTARKKKSKKKGAVKKMGILKTDFSSQKSSNMDIDIHTAVHLWLNIS